MLENKNELHGSFLGSLSLNPWMGHSSSSRNQMVGSHLGSTLTIKGSTTRRFLTGYEREYGKYTFSKKAPCDMTIIRIFKRYRETYGVGGIAENPQTIILYENADTNQIGIIELENFHCVHKDFGFRYVMKPNVPLYVGAKIKSGTIIADSPNVTEHGDYNYGLQLNVAFLSVPGVIEDGIIASESACRKMTTSAYGKRDCHWGKKKFPLNLYGDESNYKAFPDIGERVREDGLLFALRTFDDVLAPVKMTPKALRTVDFTYDTLIYADPGAKIVDIKVYCDQNAKVNTPVGMEVQADRYVNATTAFYNDIIEEYRRLKSARKNAGGLHITPEFHQLVVEAFSDSGKSDNQRITRTLKGTPLDNYHVIITFETELVPGVGYKTTDLMGGKGVICKVVPDADMPVDSKGNRAELIMDGDSTIKRTNLGRFYEHAYNTFRREVEETVRGWFGIDIRQPSAAEIKTAMMKTDIVNSAFDYLKDFYGTLSPLMLEAIEDPKSKVTAHAHVESVLKDGIYVWLPTHNPKASPQIIRDLRAKFPITFGPVTYRGQSGNVVETVSPVMIGSMYIILLDKTGTNPAAVSSAKLQHFGTPAKLTNNDKYSSPGRPTPTRIWGEAEIRAGASVMGGTAVAENLDRSNNPAKHKHICRMIYLAQNPMDIDNVVDSSYIPRGAGRPVTYVKHMLQCSGTRFERN